MQSVSLREDVLAKAESLKVLPTLNTVIDEVLRVLADENSSFNRLFNVVRYDQAISSKIVMCLVFLKEMLHQWHLSQADLALLWTHTLSVACAAKVLAARMMTEDREKVFTVSILHDIGKVPIFMHGDRYRKLMEEARRTGTDLCSLESAAFGIDHQEVGQFMAVKWRFPPEFSAVIQKHHGRVETGETLVDLVAKADRFIEDPSADLGAEGIILRGEANLIKAETKRVGDLMGVA
jgi:putative nucleotidyltransferase with HDIG domain